MKKLDKQLFLVWVSCIWRSLLIAYAESIKLKLFKVSCKLLTEKLCKNWLMQKVNLFVNPVVAVALGWAILDEPVTPRMLLAGAIIVGAVVLIANGHRTESVETTSRLEAEAG